MSNLVYLATSIDGYIADTDGEIDWLNMVPNPNGDDLGWAEFLARVDAIVMGKNTFEKVLSFGVEWPYPIPAFIVSTSMKEIPAGYEEKVEIISGTPEDITESLSKKGYKNLYIDGGSIVQQFLKVDLIDELIITRIPIVLGGGIPLFTKLDNSLKWEHIQTEVLLKQLVKSSYRRSR